MDNTTTNVQGREIRFRAWDNVLKFMVPDFHNWIDFQGNYWTSPDKGGDTPHQEIVRRDDYILMQFTGLRDKSGKEIYEKDVDEILGVCQWSQEMCEYGFRSADGWCSLTVHTEVNIKGNIYEHPHLLKTEGKVVSEGLIDNGV